MHCTEYRTKRDRENGRVGTERVSLYRLLTLVIAGGLEATADQHHDRGLDCTPLAWKKIQIPNSKHGFY